MKTPVLLLALFFLLALSASGDQGATKARLTRSETGALVQAVQDEIYDYEYEQYFFPEGGPVGDPLSSTKVRVPLYVDSALNDGEGRVIYKLMPHGEVIRFFHVRADETVTLEGDPELGFPASQPSRRTVYLRDSDLCWMKHNWVKSFVEIDLSPSPATLQGVVRRQKQRTGFSAWEFARSKEEEKQ